MPIQLIPTEGLRPSPDNPAARTDPACKDLRALQDSIAQHGLLEPPTVYEGDTPGVYEVISGHRRIACCKALGRADVPCLVVDRPPDLGRAMVRRAVVNVQRKEYRPVEFARLVTAIQAETGWNNKQVGEQFGMAPSQVGNYLALLRLGSEHQAAVDRGEIPMSVGAHMALTDDLRLREQVAAAVKQGASREAVARMLRGEKPAAGRVTLKAGRLTVSVAAAEPLQTVISALDALLRKARKAAAEGGKLETLTDSTQ